MEHRANVHFIHFRKKLTGVGGDDGVQLFPDVLEQLAGGGLVTTKKVVFNVLGIQGRLLRILGVEAGKPPGEVELLRQLLIVVRPCEQAAPDSLIS